MTDRQNQRAAGRGADQPGTDTSPAELLCRSLARLYDELNGSSATARMMTKLADRTDRQVWEQLRVEIAMRMEHDREHGHSAAPDRIPVLTAQTFRTLRWDLDADRPLTRDRLRVLQAVLAIGKPGNRLPSPWIEQARKLLAADPPATRRAGDGGKRHHEYLESVSDDALDHVRRLTGPDGVSLTDVYVVRGQEELLARLLEEQAATGAPGQPVQVVLGEPGTGKTSMLWYLATILRGRRAATAPVGERTEPPSAERRGGAVLSPRFLRGEDLLDPLEGPRLLEALDGDTSKAQVRRGRIVLLDSADLLLHAGDGRSRLQQVVVLCQNRAIPLAMTCRTRDRSQLEDALGAAPLAVSTYVEDFRFGGEVERAVTTYCRYYLPEEIQRSTADALLQAAVRGLPVREVVARPLTLRMLLQVYDKGMDTRELDAGLVYDTYWQRRVVQDTRHGARVLADVTDMSWPAQATARLMLHDGAVALPVAELTRDLPAADAGPKHGDPAEQVAILEGRGVFTRTSTSPLAAAEDPGGSVQFFHQTLYEYAAGRCMVRLADEAGLSYYRPLEQHLSDHPDDFLRASVAEQSIVQGVRSNSAAREEALGLFLRLLRSTEVDLQVIAVRCYALLPGLYPHERRQVQDYLRDEAPQAMAEELLAILPTRCHPKPETVTADLAIILVRHPRLRQRVLELLCRFSGVGHEASGAVWSLLHELCQDHRGCLMRPVSDSSSAPAGCGGDLCLWSWLVRLDSNAATSHGNLAARLVDALTDHHGAWAHARMRELLALAERDRSRAQVLQCVSPIHRRRHMAGWPDLMRIAAETAVRLGPGKDGATGPQADEADTANGQQILEAYWYAAATTDRSPLDLLRSLAGEGSTPFDTPAPHLRGVLTRLGEQLRSTSPHVVHRLLNEAVTLCRGSDRIDQVARALLPALLSDPTRPQPRQGTLAAEQWCHDHLAEFEQTARQRPPDPAVRFIAAGLARLAPDHAARLMPWSPAARPSGHSGGRPWGHARCDAIWLAPNAATRLLVPLAAAHDHQAVAGLDRWRNLEQARHDQLVHGRNTWPIYHGDNSWHGPARNTANKIIQPVLADLAPSNPTLITQALRHRIPPADLPWLAALAKSTADQPTSASATHAKAALTRYGADLAAWCSDLWDKTLPCPDANAKTAALRLWGDLVRLGAAERPTLKQQTELAKALGDKGWAAQSWYSGTGTAPRPSPPSTRTATPGGPAWTPPWRRQPPHSPAAQRPSPHCGPISTAASRH